MGYKVVQVMTVERVACCEWCLFMRYVHTVAFGDIEFHLDAQFCNLCMSFCSSVLSVSEVMIDWGCWGWVQTTPRTILVSSAIVCVMGDDSGVPPIK